MTVFVAGVHGVGKSYLCQQYALEHGVLHESASGLIQQELSQAQWSADKKVHNVDANQQALRSAVNRINDQGQSLLLDGHFVLISSGSKLICLDSSVFDGLSLTGVILIEAAPELISSRLVERDSQKSAVDIRTFMDAENAQAQAVCRSLGIPLKILSSPTYEEFSSVVSDFFKK